jgi:dTDP-4-amino-4,6-dideoxygalactose transaminase
MNKPIPLVNLAAQHDALKSKLMSTIEEVIDSSDFILGRYAKRFEAAFALALNSRHVVGCSSGTSAVSMALEAAGIGRGDEVLTVANTFFATSEAICNVGATPVFVDIDPDTYTMDPAALEAALTSRTRAIVPVHLFGVPCDMPSIVAFADAHGLAVIEDCAQAHLASFDGQCTGTFGLFGAFSFFPGKNLGALGDAGCITTQSDDLAQDLFKLRNHGRIGKYEHDTIGYNHRIDGLQAAILSAKLDYLEEWTERRIANAAAYDALIDPLGIKRITPPTRGRAVYHLYVIEVDERDRLLEALHADGIQAGVHYPLPLHLQPVFKPFGKGEGSLPVTERAAKRLVSLPMCPYLGSEEIERVVSVVRTFIS